MAATLCIKSESYLIAGTIRGESTREESAESFSRRKHEKRTVAERGEKRRVYVYVAEPRVSR